MRIHWNDVDRVVFNVPFTSISTYSLRDSMMEIKGREKNNKKETRKQVKNQFNQQISRETEKFNSKLINSGNPQFQMKFANEN